MSSDQKAMLVRITGKVQGVSFRVWTRQEALKLGLAGSVRNEADGSVVALIAGPEHAVSSMIEGFWHGPRGASVVDVQTQAVTLQDWPTGFHITG
ncbi:acylphosphatase [Agrobacterium tumefaciens]|uniref:acylphosphatase n=1 Tax=Agrobacterium tumefaciens TaxID=358 RepID=UPI0021CF907C|nr:acylphosphatase [Agrobacterium tumefaciens]UXS04014.1 acylphosphatase [Agrobacterium tumefaciens]